MILVLITCFHVHLTLFVLLTFLFMFFMLWVEFQCYRGGRGGCCWGGGGGCGCGGREEEVSLGVIMTNTEIKFHILLFTLH